MKNIIPKAKSDLVTAGTLAFNGAEALETVIGLQHNKAVDIEANLGAFSAADTAAANAATALTGRIAVVRSVALAAQERLRLGRDILRPLLGETFNQAWAVLGFSGTLQVPRRPAALPAMLFKYKDYYTANPNQEVEIKLITAAQFESLYNSLIAGFKAVGEQKPILRDARELSQTTAAALRTRLKDLKKELGLKLDPMDSRWLQFGFPIPGLKRKPAAPTGVKLTLVGPTSAAIKWDRSPRAKHYRIWKKVVGVDTEMVAVDLTAGLDFTLEDLPANATVEIAVSAVNDRGESKRSRIVTALTK